MTQIAIAALAAIMVLSIVIFSLGRRFLRGYIARYGTQPPTKWMFQRAADPELERIRRNALALLPFYLVAWVVYLLRE